VPKLTITAPSSINEGDVSQTATVTADPTPEADLTVNISSSSSADLRLEDFNQGPLTSVTISAGQTTSATIYLNAPADNTVDADASVTLTATAASGYNSGTAAVTVRNVDFNPPAIVINKIYNSGVNTPSGAEDVVELLVVGNGTPGSTVDLQGVILKDYSSSAANDGGGAYVFAANSLWSAVKAGTLIVLTKPGSTPPAEDLDGSDFVIKINLSNTTYFTAGTGTFDIGGTELVQIKASGSAQAGSTGAIHSFATGTSSAAQVVAAPAPKLICAVSGNNPFAKNSTKALADFNGTDAAQNPSALSMGLPNNADNSTFISSLRGSNDISISVDSAVAIINENAGLQAGKITVALSQPATEDVTVNLSASPSGAVTIPSTAVILNGASSASIDVTPIDDNAIAGNRVVTITGSATGWSPGNNTMTIVDVQFNSPSVVINELVNGGTGGADVVELLVVENNLDMVGMILKDFSTNMTGDAGRQFTFADNALWQSVKAGTLLVLTSDAAATEDTDASDGIITIKLTNTTYIAATGGTFDISNTDMVMIKASGSGTSGITGAIHTFGNGPAGSLFNLANGAKLLFTAGGAGGGADNATSAISDYNGTGVTAGNTLGAHNNSQNQTYIADLRASANSAPTDIGLTATSIAENDAVDAVLGTLSTTDSDVGDTFTYSLVTGPGDTDNASFNVSGASLRTSVAFDFETKSSYSVRVRTTDSGGATFEKTFTITVTDVLEGSTYNSWLGVLTPSDAAFFDYVFGAATPGTLDPTLKPMVTVTGGNLVLTYYVRQGTVGLTVTPKTSSDLSAGPSGWVTDGVTVDNVGTATTVNGVSVQQKTASVPVSGAKKFLRVEAVQQ
jgi:hypothetical protein